MICSQLSLPSNPPGSDYETVEGFFDVVCKSLILYRIDSLLEHIYDHGRSEFPLPRGSKSLHKNTMICLITVRICLPFA